MLFSFFICCHVQGTIMSPTPISVMSQFKRFQFEYEIIHQSQRICVVLSGLGTSQSLTGETVDGRARAGWRRLVPSAPGPHLEYHFSPRTAVRSCPSPGSRMIPRLSIHCIRSSMLHVSGADLGTSDAENGLFPGPS